MFTCDDAPGSLSVVNPQSEFEIKHYLSLDHLVLVQRGCLWFASRNYGISKILCANLLMLYIFNREVQVLLDLKVTVATPDLR